MAKKALGKGLDALIPPSVMVSLDKAKIVELEIESIRANPFQPRNQFDEERMQSLAKSIKDDGLLQPVVVRKKGDYYELIMGERRLQAAKLAGIDRIPAIIREAEDIDSLRLAVVENIQREDLNPLELAGAFKRLMERFDLSLDELAKMVGKDKSSVSNTMRLLNLPEKVKRYLRDRKLTEGHARAILSVEGEEERVKLADRIADKNMSVREAEFTAGLGRKRKTKTKEQKPPHIAYLEKAISKHLATRVTIEEKRGGKGKMTVEFYSHEDFERLAELMHIPLPR